MEGIEEQKKARTINFRFTHEDAFNKAGGCKGESRWNKGFSKKANPRRTRRLFERLVECLMTPGKDKEGEVDKHTHNKQSKE